MGPSLLSFYVAGLHTAPFSSMQWINWVVGGNYAEAKIKYSYKKIVRVYNSCLEQII